MRNAEKRKVSVTKKSSGSLTNGLGMKVCIEELE